MRLIDADKLGLTDFEIIMCDGDYKKAFKILLDKIENAPTVEQKHGHWYVDEQKNVWGEYVNCQVCSVCNKRNIAYDRQSNYCPHCGAKMEVTE